VRRPFSAQLAQGILTDSGKVSTLALGGTGALSPHDPSHRSSRSTTRAAAGLPCTFITTKTRRSTSSEGEVTVLVGDERNDLAAGDYLFAPRGIAHAYVVRSERAHMLVTASPGGIEQVFVSLGVPVTGSEPPTDAVMPPMDEAVRLFAGYGAEILGPPLSLSDFS
jgi:hypothetical protein